MRVLSFKAEEELALALEEVARRKKLTKSEIIRRALRKYIMEQDEKPFVTKRMKIYG